jgi:hypothetical protein
VHIRVGLILVIAKMSSSDDYTVGGIKSNVLIAAFIHEDGKDTMYVSKIVCHYNLYNRKKQNQTMLNDKAYGNLATQFVA